MKSIQVYDPALCCSTGVCGPDVDPVLPRIAAFLSQLASKGIKVERYNLAQQPMAFVMNPKVKALLDSGGVAVLPLVYIDDELVLKGSYPESEQCARWMQAALGSTQS